MCRKICISQPFAPGEQTHGRFRERSIIRVCNHNQTTINNLNITSSTCTYEAMIFTNRPRFDIYNPSPDIFQFVVTSKSTDDLYCLVGFILLALGLSTFPFRLQDLLYGPRYMSHSSMSALNYSTSIELSELIHWHGALDLVLITLLVGLFGIIARNRGYTQEALTVYRGLGIRVTTTRTGWYGYNRTGHSRLISQEQIEDMLIHEGFVGSKPKLAIAVMGEEEMVVVFPVAFPSSRFLLLMDADCDVYRQPSPIGKFWRLSEQGRESISRATGSTN